jgi:hypothetical protein
MTKRNIKKSRQKPKQKQSNAASDSTPVAAGRRKRKREVKVVVCPSAFPDFTTVGGSTSRRREQQRRSIAPGSSKYDHDKAKEINNIGVGPPLLDVQETIREVHKFGAEGFTGVQKKSHVNSEYERVTGRTAKRQKIPTKIVVGMRLKALKREEREKQELKESGVVSHHTSTSQGKKRKKNDRIKKPGEGQGGQLNGVFGSNRARNKGERRKMSTRSFGPSPDVGFMLKGMLKVKQPGR